MCTEKQIQANRANALRSTGPRTGRMEKGLLDILCNPPTEKAPSKTNIKSQFMMIMTKQYKTPSEDPEFQEFKKHKEQRC